MFERYTERARRTLFFARYEATQLGAGEIETEHLLLGLVREGKGLLGKVLGDSGLSPDRVRSALQTRATFREKVTTSTELPFSAQTKHALTVAADEATALGDQYIGTTHLLLGLLRSPESRACAVLGELGLDLDGVRAAARKYRAEMPDEAEQGPAPQVAAAFHSGSSVDGALVVAAGTPRALLAAAYGVAQAAIVIPPDLQLPPHATVHVASRAGEPMSFADLPSRLTQELETVLGIVVGREGSTIVIRRRG